MKIKDVIKNICVGIIASFFISGGLGYGIYSGYRALTETGPGIVIVCMFLLAIALIAVGGIWAWMVGFIITDNIDTHEETLQEDK